MKGQSVAATQSTEKPAPAKSGRWRRGVLIGSFILPALIMLGAFVLYPIIYTFIRSFYDASGAQFIGFENYVHMFTNDSTYTAIRNNVMWVIIAPLSCTFLGLIFAVLMEKVRWKTAFRLVIFMPMAISMLAAGVIFRTMFQQDPNLGVVNAAAQGIHSAFSDEASYPGARVREGFDISDDDGAIASTDTLEAGNSLIFPLIGVKQANLPDDARQAVAAPAANDSQITGTVFLDVILGGGGTQGQIDEGKSGLPGIRVDAVDVSGAVASYATTGEDGTFVIDGLDPGGTYRLALPPTNFEQGFQGISWLGPSLINAVIILSYIWIWAGFAMVMIASGLSAIDRSLQEAARTDGANEWQVFRKITAPLLSPVLVVVLVTLIINVLKIFDLVYVIAPGQSKPAANVIAVEMWTVSFGGGNDHGMGSALAILLLVLVLPSMIINVRRFREEASR